MRAGRVELPRNVTVRSLGKEIGRSEPWRVVEFYRALGALLVRNRYDAAFAHMAPLFAAMAAPLLRACRIPLVLWYARGGAASRTLRVAAWWADTVVTPSRDSFPLAGDRLVVTGHGIDTTRFAPAAGAVPHGGFRVVSVGRVAPVKRLEVLVDAAGVLRDGFAPGALQVSIVGPVLEGDRAYRERLARRIHDAGLSDIVSLEGPVLPARVPDVYRAADVGVNLSDTDSVDKAALEAMACGVPVVVSNRSFAPILGPVDGRLLVPKGDAALLAGQLARLAAAAPTERAALGERLRAVVVRDHSLDRLADLLVTDVFRRSRRTIRRIPSSR
jgi:glycosyltransferase involved in cell wall biosynthesis